MNKRFLRICFSFLTSLFISLLTSNAVIGNPLGAIVYVTGIIQTSGLHKKEEDKLGIRARYQIHSPKQSFFIAGGMRIEKYPKYWGRCVTIKGRLVNGWHLNMVRKNNQYTYERSAIELLAIDVVPCEKCFDSPHMRREKRKIEAPSNGYETLRGFILKRPRPAPDIAYDYELMLEKPINLEKQGGKKVTKHVPLYIDLSLKQLNQLAQEKKVVDFIGYFEMGYQEKLVFTTAKIVDQ